MAAAGQRVRRPSLRSLRPSHDRIWRRHSIGTAGSPCRARRGRVMVRAAARGQRPVNRNVRLLYAFSFFNPFMIVIPVWVPYLATQGITMRQFMELQAVFAVVILCGEVPTGLLSDLWGRKKTLLAGSILKAISFSLLPFWTTYEGFLVYHLMMGIA